MSIWFGLLGFVVIGVTYEYIFESAISVGISLGLAENLRLDNIEEGSGRFIAWDFAWKEIQTSPIIGSGFGYDVNLMQANFNWLSRAGHEGGVHNTYLIIWLNTGVIGLILFLRALILLTIQASKRSYVALPILLAVMISIMFEPWLAASLNPYTSMFLVALTIMVSPIFFSKDEEPEVEEVID